MKIIEFKIASELERNHDYLKQVLSIQKSHLLDQVSPQENGHLITMWEQFQLLNLIQSGSVLYVALDDTNKAIGYALISKISEFLSQTENEDLKITVSAQVLKNEPYHYLHQGAVAPSQHRKSIALKLIEYIIQESKVTKLISDCMIEPIENKASRHFFKKLGFQEIGFLRLKSYLGLPPSKWVVVSLNCSDSE